MSRSTKHVRMAVDPQSSMSRESTPESLTELLRLGRLWLLGNWLSSLPRRELLKWLISLKGHGRSQLETCAMSSPNSELPLFSLTCESEESSYRMPSR